MKCLKCNDYLNINNDKCDNCGLPIPDIQKINYYDKDYYMKKNTVNNYNFLIIFTIVLSLMFTCFVIIVHTYDFLGLLLYPIGFLIFLFNKKNKLNKELSSKLIKIEQLQYNNSFEICNNCGCFKYKNEKCYNCNLENVRLNVNNNSITRLFRKKIIMLIIIIILGIIAFFIAGNWESNYYEAHHDDSAGWFFIMCLLPGLLLGVGALLIATNSYYNAKINKIKYIMKIR